MMSIKIQDLLALVCIVMCLVDFCHGASRDEACNATVVCTDGTNCPNDVCVCDTTGSYYYVSGTCYSRVQLDEQCYKGTQLDGTQCIDSSAECVADANQGIEFSCQCETTHFASGTSCFQIVNLGDACQPASSGDQSLPCLATNAECSTSGGGNTCQCKDTHYQSGSNICSESNVVNLGDACQPAFSGDQSLPCLATNAECLTSGGGNTCQCKSTHYQSVTNTCSLRNVVNLGDVCQLASSGDQSLPCLATNAECSTSGGGNTCQCKDTHYQSGINICSESNVLNLVNVCQPASSSGDASLACLATNAECSNSGNICQCKRTHYQFGTNACSESNVVNLGDACQPASSGDQSIPCLATNAECLTSGGGNTCQCKSTHYQSVTNTCSLRNIVNLGDACQPDFSGDQSLPCLATNAECLTSGGGNTCQCKSTHYQSVTNTCSLRNVVNLGDACQPASSGEQSIPCLATNAECLTSGGGNTCQCKSTHYQSVTNTCSLRNVVNLGDACQPASSGEQSIPCLATNAECLTSGGGNTCQCKSTHYQSVTNTCSLRNVVKLGLACQPASSSVDANLVCSAANAECSGSGNSYTCQCKNTHYQSGSNKCSESNVVNLGLACQQASSSVDASLACSATNAECILNGNSYTCQCKDTHYQSGTNECSESNVVNLSQACQPASFQVDASLACSAINAECSNSGDGNIFVSLGQTCQRASSGVQTLPCLANNAKCLSHASGGFTCQCITTYYQSGDNTCTLSNEVSLGQTCQQATLGDQSLPCSATDAECLWSTNKFTCQCKSSYYKSGTDICSPIVTLDQSCQLASSLDQSVPCSATNAQCLSNGNSGYTCQCESTHYNSGPNTCSEKKDLGVTCTSAAECRANNVVCTSSTGNTCNCDSGYYQSDSITCSPQSNIDGPCSNTQECNANNVECTGGTCSCVIGYYKSSSNTCSQQGFLGVTCTSAVECSANNVVCTGNCSCASGYYQSGSNTCSLIVTLGQACLEASLGDQSLPCSATNAQCLSSGNSGNTTSCQCKSTHYQSETNTCSQIQALGGSCIVYAGSVSAPCSASSAECTKTGDTYTCLCSSIYYQAGNNMCSSVSELRVTSITFSAIDTTSMVVSWVPPTNKITFIDKYIVVWKPYGSNIVGSTLEITGKPLATTATLSTNITPGDGYKISITSVNTQTQAGSDRSALKEARQSAKPLPPSSENENSSNLDASDGNIYLVWNRPSAGEVNGYRLNLPQLGLMNQSVTSASYMYTNPDLLNGQRYNLTIESRSEYFGSGYVWSDPFTWEFKTVVQVPGPPRNVMCVDDDITDESIFLTWSAPEFPNGDIVQYHIFVSGDPTFNVNTEIDTRQFKIENLNPGRDYSFKIQTQNELYNSISMSNQAYCTTRARMSEAPRMLMKTDVTSRDFTVSWKRPDNTHSAENWGYVLQVRKSSETDCLLEKLFKCSGCQTFQESTLSKMCPTVREQTKFETLTELDKDKSYKIIGLDPDTTYSIIVTSVTSAGRGHEAEIVALTNEEAPQPPTDVQISDILSTSFLVSWNLPSPRPGHVIYTIVLHPDPAGPTSKPITVIGFESRTYNMTGVEEYWNYTVTVKAKTGVPDEKQSAPSETFTTLPAVPGPVSGFNIETSPGGDYTKIKVTWKAPTLLQRNSIIKHFVLNTNATTSLINILGWNFDDEYVYTREVNVQPEGTYSFEVYAVNTEGTYSNGVVVNNIIMAPAGVPRNDVEETQNVQVVTSGSKGEKTISLNISQDFLNQEAFGTIRATGLIGCASAQCDFNALREMPLADFNTMDNWQKANGNGYTTYRITKASWITDMNRNGNRERRATGDNIGYTVGVETCSNDDDYCNGELKEDTEYIIVVVACTNGGCLLSKEYGPFKTEAVPATSTPIGMIVGIAVGVVVVAAIVIVVIIFIRRRHSFPRHLSNMHNLETGDKKEDVTHNKRNRHMLVNNVDSKRGNKHKDSNDSNLLNSAEYEGYSSPREYIGCHGPSPGTIDDFWKMTWKQNVPVIVMLTMCNEEQNMECDTYWPDKVGYPKHYGDVLVEVMSYLSIKTYDYRMLKLTNGKVSRVVKHFHFPAWQELQDNIKHDVIINFIKSVRSHIQPPDTAGPSIIHCSAEVGRVDTYIALDRLMQFINNHDFSVPVDVFNHVFKICIIQTEQQYNFIHDCLKEMLKEKGKMGNEVNNTYESLTIAEDGNIYATVQEPNLYQNTEI